MEDTFTTPLDLAITVTTIFGVISSFWLAIAANNRAQKTEQAELYFLIGERWTEVLRILYEVRQSPPPNIGTLESLYGDSYREFMSTNDWKEKYRMICNFYEDIGLIVYNKNLDIGTVKGEIYQPITK